MDKWFYLNILTKFYIIGLKMTIFVNRSENLFTTMEYGLKVLVHDQAISPFPNVEGKSFNF